MEPFIPPSFSLPLHWTADLLFPFLLKGMHNINKVIIKPEDLEMIRKLRHDRLIFFTNHPSTAEPPITYHIGNEMGCRFKFMASRQVFNWAGGAAGVVISNLGAFSVIAGIPDRESMKTFRRILSEPGGKMVTYPEGEPTSGENDSLMPFQPGVAQMGFWALEDARKNDPNADVTVLPGFIKYVVKATRAEIENCLIWSIEKLEKTLGVNPGDRNLLRRYLYFGKVLLEQAEREYRIPPASKGDFDYRIGRVRHAILDNVADKLNAKNYDRKADAIVKLRTLFALVEMITIDYPDPSLPKLSPAELEWASRECIKAFDIIVIKRDYLMSNPTPERFLEWLLRFESYVLDKKPRALGGEPTPLPREAHVFFAKPFYLSEYYPEDKKKRKTAIDDMLKRLRGDMQKMLDEAQTLTKPLVKPFDIGDEKI